MELLAASAAFMWYMKKEDSRKQLEVASKMMVETQCDEPTEEYKRANPHYRRQFFTTYSNARDENIAGNPLTRQYPRFHDLVGSTKVEEGVYGMNKVDAIYNPLVPQNTIEIYRHQAWDQ